MYLTDEQLTKIREVINPITEIVGDENQVLNAVKQALWNSNTSSGYTIIHVGRNFGKNHFASSLRDLGVLQNTIVIDDIDEPPKTNAELAEQYRENQIKWIETYCLKGQREILPNQRFLVPEKQNIKLGVKKRYRKAPKIQILTGRQYFEFHLKLTDKFTKEVMRQKKDIKRPTLKAESIFDAEKRLKQQAKHTSKTFVHTKPVKYLLK